jgi:nicotinamidase-related amidase
MIVDLQRGMAEGNPELVELATRTATFVREHRERWQLVVASRFLNQPGSMYQQLVEPQIPAVEATELLPAIEAIDVDLVIDKCTYSSITDELLDQLHACGVTELEVVGADTDQCVLATVLAAFDAQLAPVVWSDLVWSTAGSTPHEAGLVALRRAIGEDRVRAGAAESRTHTGMERT